MDFYSLVYVKSTLVGRLSEALCSLSDCLYKRPVVLGKQKRKWRSWRKMSAINAVQFPCISTKEDLHFWPVRNTWKCHSPLQITDLMLRLPLKSQFLFKMNVAPIVLCKKIIKLNQFLYLNVINQFQRVGFFAILQHFWTVFSVVLYFYLCNCLLSGLMLTELCNTLKWLGWKHQLKIHDSDLHPVKHYFSASTFNQKLRNTKKHRLPLDV